MVKAVADIAQVIELYRLVIIEIERVEYLSLKLDKRAIIRIQ